MATSRSTDGVADREPGAEVVGGSPLLSGSDEAEAIEITAQNRQGDVGENRHRQDEPKLAAILGNVGDAEIHAVARRTDCDGLAVEDDGSRGRGFDAEKCEPDIGAARPDKAGEA